MERRNIPWKAEWKAAGLDAGPLTEQEEALAEELRSENERFLTAHPFQPKKRALPLSVWSFASAAALLILALPLMLSPPVNGPERIKGSSDPALVIYRQSNSGSEKLKSGTVVRPGDVLQAAYRVTEPLQGALVSVDGNLNVTVHLAKEGRSVALVSGAEQSLEFSYELDAAPRFEVFLLLVSKKPFELEPIRQLLKSIPWDALKPGSLGADIRFTELALQKELSK